MLTQQYFKSIMYTYIELYKLYEIFMVLYNVLYLGTFDNLI